VWAEGVAPDGTIALNDLQKHLVALAQQIDAEHLPQAPIEDVEPAPAPEPPFRSEAELGEFIEACRRRHLDAM
jgi:hypothetical protein